MNLIRKIWESKRLLRNILQSIYFNFHYLPFKQAVRLPILLYKPHFLKLKGKVIIDADNVKFGMIRMGFRLCGIYPNTGISWENNGGTVVFKGKANIGNDVYFVFGENTKVEFGDDFRNFGALKLVSYRGIKFGVSTSFGWGCLIMDTNFHPLYDMVNKRYKKASGPIEIGDYNWFGTQCKVMHSVVTPERCVFGMNTTVTRGSVMKSYCVMGGEPVRILSENVMRDYDNDHDEFTYGTKK
ncbi:MAG: hypothetical protein E7090_04955 [Bacteroidales bacterium]|nr:hypothetical protein [Bacteroidales bacterium]